MEPVGPPGGAVNPETQQPHSRLAAAAAALRSLWKQPLIAPSIIRAWRWAASSRTDRTMTVMATLKIKNLNLLTSDQANLSKL